MDSCPSPVHPRVRTVSVCSASVALAWEMRGYGLAALVPLAIVNPSPRTRDSQRGPKAITTANLQIELPEFHLKNHREWVEDFSEFLLLTGQHNADVKTNCTLIKKSSKNVFLQRQVKTAIRKSKNLSNLLK